MDPHYIKNLPYLSRDMSFGTILHELIYNRSSCIGKWGCDRQKAKANIHMNLFLMVYELLCGFELDFQNYAI